MSSTVIFNGQEEWGGEKKQRKKIRTDDREVDFRNTETDTGLRQGIKVEDQGLQRR